MLSLAVKAAYEDGEERRKKRLGLGQWATADLDAVIVAMLNGGVSAGGIEGAYWNVSDLSTVFSDRAGTVLAAIDGPIGLIKDKGPNARHLIADSDATRGTLRFIGGVYYLESDGLNTKYNTGTLSTHGWLCYLAMVAKRPSTVAVPFMRFFSNVTYSRLYCANAFATGNSRNVGGGPTSVNTAANSWPANTFGVGDTLIKAGSVSAGINGGAYATSASAISETSVAGVYRLFSNEAGSGGVAVATAGVFAGGFAANMEPSTDQRAALATRLGQLGGLTL